jgi:hypothetical protein
LPLGQTEQESGKARRHLAKRRILDPVDGIVQ